MSRDPAVVLSTLNSQTARDYMGECLADPRTVAPLPRVCAQLAELTAQQSIDAGLLARLIQVDPALAEEIMRVANSPALRARSAIVSLPQAVTWLGVAEVRNIAMAVILRGEIFVAPGHEPQSEELWREVSLAGLWAKEIARERHKPVEGAYLAALMHRAGAALALKILSRFEREQRTAMDARTFGSLVADFEPAFGRLLMSNWHLPNDVQEAATDWREYQHSSQKDLAATVHAAHLLATHTMHPQLLGEDIVLESTVFEQLGVFLNDRRRLLEKRDQVRRSVGS